MELVDMIKSAWTGSKPAEYTCKSDNMSPKSDSGRSWNLPSGRDLLGKIITSAQSGFTQSKNNFVQTGRQCSSFLRLNSQGESTTSEEDLSSFPTVCPPTSQDEMYRTTCQVPDSKPHWRSYQPKGYYHPIPRPSFTSMGLQPGNHNFSQQWPVAPQMAHMQMKMGSYNQWIPQNPPMCPGVNPTYPNYTSDVFQFRGMHHNGYRDTSFDTKKQYCNSKNRGLSPNAGRNWNKCSKQQKRKKSRERSVPHAQPQNREQSLVDRTADLTNGMSSMNISSKRTSGLDVILNCVENEPEIISSPGKKLANFQASETLVDKEIRDSVPATQALDSVPKRSERIDDKYLAIELCSSSKPSEEKKDNTIGANHSQPASTHKSEPARTSHQPLHTTCIVMTPKASCDNSLQSKKKSRPSAKKRRRRQTKSTKDHLFQLTRNNKKSKTEESSNTANITKPRCDSMSFVIDFSESDISEAENIVGSSPICSSSSPLAKFSLFISGADLSSDSDDEESSESETSDSDFFDEDQPDHVNDETPSKSKLADMVSPHFAMDVYPEFEQFSPFTVQIRCNFSSASSPLGNLSNKKAQECENISQLNKNLDLEVSSEVREANKRWNNLYGPELIHRENKLPKVCFVEDSVLASVHTLRPEEVEIYEQARKGPWEEYARDRERFNKRIQDVENSISYCLDSKHRAKVLQRLQE